MDTLTLRLGSKIRHLWRYTAFYVGRSPRIATGPTYAIRHTGIRNNLGLAYHYQSIDHFKQEIRSFRSDKPFDVLLAMNFITNEFIDYQGPKLFYSLEPPGYMDEESVQRYADKDLQRYMLRYDDQVMAGRMFFPAFDPVKSGSDLYYRPGQGRVRDTYARDLSRLIGRLEKDVLEKRHNLCCLINRFKLDDRLPLLDERIRFAEAFGPHIDIYGPDVRGQNNGWLNYPTYRGASADKSETLRGYTFALTFENCDYPGYITEKLFDVIKTGCIPLYWGGGGLEKEVIPSDCYIDCRGLSPNEALSIMLTADEETLVRYRRAAIAFLSSDRIRRFTWDSFVRTIHQRFLEQRGTGGDLSMQGVSSN